MLARSKTHYHEGEQQNRGLSSSPEWTVPVDGVIHMFFDKKKDDPKKKKPQSSPFRIAWNPSDEKDRSLFEKFFIFKNIFKGK